MLTTSPPVFTRTVHGQTGSKSRAPRGAVVAALIVAAAAIAISGSLALTGCTSRDASGASATPAGSAGGGDPMMGGAAGTDGGMVSGVIAAPEYASIKVAASVDTSGQVTIEEVVAPADGWIVARSIRSPGWVLGSTKVKRGRNTDVPLKLDRLDSAAVRLALHVDRGARGTLEFDPKRPERSRDKPVVAGGKPVEKSVSLATAGHRAPPHDTSLLVDDQLGVEDALKIRQVYSVEPSWLVISTSENGFPGKQLGIVAVNGEQFQLLIPLDSAPPGRNVVVTLHSDTGQQGVFEYRADDPLGSPDQPYRLADAYVTDIVRVR